MKEITGLGQSTKETVFLGPTASNEQLEKYTIIVAEKLRTDVFDVAGDDVIKRANANKILSDMTGGKANDIAGLDKKIEDSGNSDQDLIRAREVMANATYLLLRDGGDTASHDALVTGVTSTIEGVLPNPLQPLAREVRNRVIKNADILSVIDQVDTVAVDNMWGLMPPLPRERIEVLDGAWERLKRLGNTIPSNHPDRPQYTRAFLFLRAQIGNLREEMAGGGQRQGDPNTNALIEAIKGIETSKVGFNEWVENLTIDSPYSLHSEQMPLWYTDPKLVGIEDFEGRLGEWQSLVWTANSINNWVAYKRGGSYKPEDLFSNPEIMGIGEASMTKLWKNEAGLRWAAREMFQHLYTRDKSFPDKKVFAIRLLTNAEVDVIKGKTPPEQWWEFDVNAATTKWSGYLDKLADKMVASGVVTNLNLAKIYVSTASHLFSDTTAVDAGDTERENNGRAMDPIRTIFRPEEKARQKMGAKLTKKRKVPDSSLDQQYGGKLAELMRRLVDFYGKPEIDILDVATKTGKMLYFPKAVCLSWIEMAKVTGWDGVTMVSNREGKMIEVRREMTVAEMLMSTDETVPTQIFVGEERTEVVDGVKRTITVKVAKPNLEFGRGGDDSLYGVYKRDQWPAAVFLGNVFKGDEPLDDKSMAEWIKDFSNKRTEVLKIDRPLVKGEGSRTKKSPLLEGILNDPRFTAMAIVNSLGAASPDQLLLHRDVLAPISDDQKYDAIISKILTRLTGMSEEFKQKVRDILHANKISASVSMLPEITPPYQARKRIRAESRAHIKDARSRGIE